MVRIKFYLSGTHDRINLKSLANKASISVHLPNELTPFQSANQARRAAAKL